MNKVIIWTTGELAKHVYMMYIHKSGEEIMCWQMLGKKDSPGPLFYLLDMSRGSLSSGCECWSVVQNASVAIVFTLKISPILHRVSALTPTPLLLSSLVDMLQAGLTPLCLAWSNSHCCCTLSIH